MALIGRRGRPRREAVFPGTEDKGLFYYNLFYNACATLSYADCVSLANGLDISLRQVYNWRNSVCFPRDIGIALTVMDWVAAGKPTRLVSQRELYESLY